eukprot:Plantae.Rhodophyta-Hildenbrandia_rubra.ctg5784.p1 GENE.Plantae.Rhodophyta-Hildenbrandia_rubra.ctg5784~~Plantae.Rhodophyta-Hildenbrandia_rubra.ctg5784.p1  ORF type:complete len:625 (-),score=96.20 Plantae.Rhodophyta-Hildenbrandia_rubra.ctg5784:1963-3837(-)
MADSEDEDYYEGIFEELEEQCDKDSALVQNVGITSEGLSAKNSVPLNGTEAQLRNGLIAENQCSGKRSIAGVLDDVDEENEAAKKDTRRLCDVLSHPQEPKPVHREHLNGSSDHVGLRSTGRKPISEVMRERKGMKPKREKGPAQQKKRVKFMTRAEVDKENRRLKAAHSFEDHKFSGMRISEAPFPYTMLEVYMDRTEVIKMNELQERIMEIKSKLIKEYVIFGCIVKKSQKKHAKDGRKYITLTICDMAGNAQSIINLILWNKAFEQHNMEQPGAVLCVRRPDILSPLDNRKAQAADKEYTQSGYALSVKSDTSIKRIGTCTDFAYCSEKKRNGDMCGGWVNLKFGDACKTHRDILTKHLTRSKRPSINTAVRPAPANEDIKGGQITTNLSEEHEQMNPSGDAINIGTDKAVVRDKENFKKLKSSSKVRGKNRGFLETGRVERFQKTFEEKPLLDGLPEHIKDAIRRLLEYGFEVRNGSTLVPPAKTVLVDRAAKEHETGHQKDQSASDRSEKVDATDKEMNTVLLNAESGKDLNRLQLLRVRSQSNRKVGNSDANKLGLQNSAELKCEKKEMHTTKVQFIQNPIDEVCANKSAGLSEGQQDEGTISLSDTDDDEEDAKTST